MPILSKGYTFTSTEQVTSTKLGQLVDNATFVSGAVDGITTDLSGGSIIVKNGGITPTKLSSGGPTWTASEVSIPQALVVQNTVTSGGSISTSGNLAVNGTTALTGDATLSGKIVRAGTTPNRTVQLQTAATSGNANVISFGWNNPDLLVTIDGVEFKVTLTPV